MNVAVWRTGHIIADTVADAVHAGSPGSALWHTAGDKAIIPQFDVHIGYGILRGMEDVFHEATKHRKLWIHLDNGYTNAGHFNGKYRVSIMGTQQTFGFDKLTKNDCPVKLAPWRGLDSTKPVLICQPTQHVCRFFNIDIDDWLETAKTDYYVIRPKGLTTPINYQEYNYVKTFNSSVGWEALRQGIPCVSDSTCSIVGSYFTHISLDELVKKQYLSRHELFSLMSSLQLTLSEIRSGALWPIVEKLLSSSDMMTAKQSPAM